MATSDDQILESKWSDSVRFGYISRIAEQIFRGRMDPRVGAERIIYLCQQPAIFLENNQDKFSY